MNIEANLKKLKTSIKRRKKITLTLMLGFLMTGVIGYANDISVYIDAKNEKVLTEGEYNKLNEDEKKKYNKVIIDKNNNVYTIKIDNALHFFSVKSEIKEKLDKNNETTNYENDAAKGKNTIAIGPKALSESDMSVAIGYNAKVKGNGGNNVNNGKEDEGIGSVAIGENSLITTNGLNFPSIAIGKNSKVLNGSGKQERVLSFMDGNYEGKCKIFGCNTIPKDVTKIPGGIAIGTDAFARSGSIQIGAHIYTGKMGGIDVVKNDNSTIDTNGQANIVNMTTIGTNSYQKAAMGTMVGAYNISTGNFTGEGGLNSWSYGAQNFGSSVFGTLNSIRSKGEGGNFGVANSIVGIANTTEKSNGSLIFGAGNVITNSNEELKLTDTVTGSFENVDKAVGKFQTVIKESKAGGATLAIGGANNADYTRQVSMIGTRNEVKGTDKKKTELVSVSGDNNLVENSRNIVAGKNFHVIGEGNILQGYNNIKDEKGFLQNEYNYVENIRKEKLKKAQKKVDDTQRKLDEATKENNTTNITIYRMQLANYKKEVDDSNKEKDRTPYEDKVKRNFVKNNNVVALGNGIEINTDNSVYLGTKSTEAKAENTTLWNNKDKDEYKTMYEKYAGFDHIGGIVTVGNDKLTRVIQNVAPGLITKDSTDAINGSQLYKFANQYITIKGGKGGETKVKLGDTLTLKGIKVDITVEGPKSEQTNNTPEKPKDDQPAVTTQPAQSAPATPTSATPSTSEKPKPKEPTQKEPTPQEHTATFEVKGNVGGSDTFGYKYRDDKGNETELTEGPDGNLYTKKFIENNEYKNKKWVKKGTDIASENVDKNKYEKSNEKVILSTKYGKIITDVANGVKDNDAVNVSQLKAVSTEVEKNTSDIQQLQKDVKEVDKKSDLALGGVANAVAIANLVQVNSYSDYRHNLSAAYGYYGGSHALAIGFSGVTKDRRLVYKLSGSVNNKGNLAFGVGAGVMLGNKEESMEHKDIDVKELYEKISKLEKENSEFREMFKKLGVMK